MVRFWFKKRFRCRQGIPRAFRVKKRSRPGQGKRRPARPESCRLVQVCQSQVKLPVLSLQVTTVKPTIRICRLLLQRQCQQGNLLLELRMSQKLDRRERQEETGSQRDRSPLARGEGAAARHCWVLRVQSFWNQSTFTTFTLTLQDLESSLPNPPPSTLDDTLGLADERK